MSLFKQMQSRQIQKKANSFIHSLENKSEKEIEQAYLDNKEFENNEIVLSHLFFKYPSLIRILPIEFQKSRINSNLSMFKYGSVEAKRLLVSSWFSDNKFFMNANSINLDEDEINDYLKIYFSQPNDISKLYMEDLKRVITALAASDIKQTEKLLNTIKESLSDRQWEFIIVVNPMFIKYASQTIQNKYSEDEKYLMYLSGEALEKYNNTQIEKIKEDISLLDKMGIDIQKEYITRYPYMINYINTDVLVELLKYDINLIKYINMPSLKNRVDDSYEIIYGILENIENKPIKEIVNIFINKGVLNAKGKLFRFDNKSNNLSYQYTKRIISIIQKLNTNQIMSLINIDVNYVLPYIVPVYNDTEKREEKEKSIIDCNSRCLNLFKAFYGEETYNKFYKVINKIYNEYLANIEKYDYSKDFNCIFDLFKILFNKGIMTKNNPEKITVFIGMNLLYKTNYSDRAKATSIKLLNEILSCGYGRGIDNDKDIYNIYSLEIFDDKLSFINNNLLKDFASYNYVNMSNLLFLSKSDRVRECFIKYYTIMKNIYGEDKETLYRVVENFQYYAEIIKNVKLEELNDKEMDNFIDLVSTYGNYCNVRKQEELASYDIKLLKKLINELDGAKDESVYRNLLCNYIFNKGFDDKGNNGWLEIDTIKELCDVYDASTLKEFKVDNKPIFTEEEVNLFSMAELMFFVKDADLLLKFIDNVISKKVQRNVLGIIDLFNKIKKYKLDIINDQIVTLKEIEMLYKDRPDIVRMNSRNGVTVYSVVNQDFKVLCSNNNDGIHYECVNVTSLKKNSYCYDELIKEGSFRFIDYEGTTLIKFNKDHAKRNSMKPTSIIVVGKLTDELIGIASTSNLKIIEIQND